MKSVHPQSGYPNTEKPDFVDSTNTEAHLSEMPDEVLQKLLAVILDNSTGKFNSGHDYQSGTICRKGFTTKKRNCIGVGLKYGTLPKPFYN